MKYYIFRDENGEAECADAENMAEAKSSAEKWVLGGSWGDDPTTVSVSIYEYDTEETRDDDEWDGWVESAEVHVGVNSDPEPPDCVDGEEHDWQSPEWLGGCRENPGVWAIGGTQISSTEVCSRCGLYRHYRSESTPGQYPIEAERTWYDDADEKSLDWVSLD